MTKIKLKEWANIAEIVGALAVVISLVYVGIQVRDGAGATRSAAANDANVALQAWYIQVGADPAISELYYRGLLSEQALPDAEEFQYLMMMHGFFLGVQNVFLLAEEGTIDEELRNSLTIVIKNINQLPGMERYWRQRRSYLHAGFAEWVERVSAQDPDASMDIYRKPKSEFTEEVPE